MRKAARFPTGDEGEIWINSQSVMNGYWNLPEATAATMTGGDWVRTGDAGLMDEDGYVYVRDRVKDMIVSGGENIYPAEVESAMYGHPAIAEVAVIAIPDQKWGEAVKAIVVLKGGAAADTKSILDFTRREDRRLQGPEDHRLRGRAAQERNRQGAQARIAQTLLGRPRAPGELNAVRAPPWYQGK